MDGKDNSKAGLNEFQARHLRIACQHIDKLLGDMEEVLHASESKSVFPRYVPELSPVQRKTIEDYAARLRAQLLRVLRSQQIDPEPSRVAEAHALHTFLTFVEIALEELTPEDMAGYGAVTPEGAIELKGIAQELMATTAEMHGYVMQRSRHDIGERLQQLRGSTALVKVLDAVQRIISRHGLVEFRPRLLMLLDLLENKNFEIGIFGRVSSGKSSLLNHVIGQNVLPVGVTPITAVPTRIRYGQIGKLLVFRETASPEEFAVSELAAFVDERQNPANAKRISRIVLELSALPLKDGLVFVDTPGLGSLATSGAAETLAYLPRCDYGIILIDAAGALTHEDLKTVEALRTASIPISILISKADLASEDDLRRLISYVAQHILSETGFSIPVHAVSVLPSHRRLLEAWLNEEIAPMHSRVTELKEQSLSRKCEGLARSVLDTLRRQLTRSGSKRDVEDAEAAETRLRRASALIEDTRQTVEEAIRNLPALTETALATAAHELTAKWMAGEVGSVAILNAVLTREATSFAEKCYRAIKELADSLRKNLEQASRALGGHSETVEEFRLKELPIFQASLTDVTLNRTAIAAISRILTHSLAARRLQSFREPAQEILANYAKRLREWSHAALAGVEKQFDSYAQEYRSQAQRVISGSGQAVDAAELKADIAALERLTTIEDMLPASGM